MQAGCATTGSGPKEVEALSRDLGCSTELSPQLPEQMSQQREQPCRVEPELQGPGHLSDLEQQVRQSARRSWDPQVAPRHKNMSTQTEPPCGGVGCVYMVRGSARRRRLRLRGARPSKEMQMVSTQEKTPQRKECCVLKGQASAKGYRLRLHGALPSRQMQTASTQSPDLPGEADRTNAEQCPPRRHRQHQHQGLWLCQATQTATAWTTALQSTDGWSIRERRNARRRRRLQYLRMQLFRTSLGSPWRTALHAGAGWVSTKRSFLRRRRRVHASRLSEEAQVTCTQDEPQQASAGHGHQGERSISRCKPCLQGSPATSVQGETPQKDVSCVDSCSASGKLCLQKPELCVETQAGSAQNQPMAAQDKVARSSDEAASTQDDIVPAQDEVASVPSKVVPVENEAMFT
ncbi:hypothetical protein mRhiFer1_007824 [Rhinolophus ferrumequinum]|uniref:Uncharacterized protein n=1 Tax=Rhinolophus ferrumequinum TaxID=59479 RepID=A0A7J8AV05_RHIFE|nr:hypothetical protein mRhiFer1_007824 [Rhinolophus ferrumequinum]